MKFKLDPYQWQHKALAMSNEQTNMALLADMGTGKTGAMINILRLRYGEKGRIMRTLILSPLVTLFNWKDEFEKHSYIHPQNVHVLYGGTAKKEKAFHRANDFDPNQILLMNYEGMISPKMLKLIDDWKPEIIVLDESHYCKNYKTKRSKNIFAVRQHAEHCYIMTGTPMTNDIPDLFMQYKILDGGETFGTNFFVFQRKFMVDQNSAWAHQQNHFPKWVARPDKMEEINGLVYSKAIRVTKDETLDLPPLRNITYKIPLSAKQQKYYKEMERDFLVFVEEGEKKGIAVAQLAVTKALRLQQIVTGFVVDEDKQVIEIEDNPRLTALKDLISSLHVNHKVIVWCSFIHNYKQIGAMLEKLGVKHNFIVGGMSLPEKRDAMDAFNKDTDTRVIVCNRKAGGIGINLVAADYSIVYSRNFSLEEELQSRDRNYRGGSEIHEQITRINLVAADTVDERTTEALLAKKKVSDNILHYVKGVEK